MTLKLCVNFPLTPSDRLGQWLGGHAFTDVAQQIEELGFDAIAVTDHPYPARSWLESGGHHALDPFVSLGAAAVATNRIALITSLAVAGYRNPYLTAKAASSVDFVSDGRLVLGLGAGYMREEFDVLGADFGRRGALFDAAIPAIRAAWAGEDNDDPYFPAHGHEALPQPIQAGGPPIWVGGNSRAARRRAATMGDGWIPLPQSPDKVARTRTPALTDLDSLAAHIAEIREARHGREDTAFDVLMTPFQRALLTEGKVEEFCDAVVAQRDDYEAVGVTWLFFKPEAENFATFTRHLETLADAFVR